MSEKEYLLQLLDLRNRVHRNDINNRCPHCGSQGNWGGIIKENKNVNIMNHTCYLCGFNVIKYEKLIEWIKENV